MREIFYHRQSLDNLASIPKKPRRQIVNKIDKLAEDPMPRGSKLLQNYDSEWESAYRVRSGDYRIIYAFNETRVVILDIDHRKDVYKK